MNDKIKNNGFTLIELSIVLVIISLIVGGVLGGKSLIEAAKVNGIVSEANKYITAYNNFKLQFDAIPGDFREGYAYFANGDDSICGNDSGQGHSDCDGDGDNLIEWQEHIKAFFHLQASDILVTGVGPAQGTTFNEVGVKDFHSDSSKWNNVPQAENRFNDYTGWMYVSHAAIGDSNWYSKTGNWLQYGAMVTGWRYLDGGALVQRHASAIDKKIDDGKLVRGNVTAMNGSTYEGGPNVYHSPSCTANGEVRRWSRHNTSLNSTYSVSENNLSCVLHFYLGD